MDTGKSMLYIYVYIAMFSPAFEVYFHVANVSAFSTSPGRKWK